MKKNQTSVKLGASLPSSNKRELKLPHEQDQSALAGVDNAANIDLRARKAAKDAQAGVPDTSRAPEANIAYQHQK